MARPKNRKKAESPRGARRKPLIKLLTQAYNAEIETVANYLANSVHLDGMLAMEIKESLGRDVEEELGHARALADRIKILGGKVPGSLALAMTQKSLQPPDDPVDLKSVILGVIEAEDGAIELYQRIIDAAGDDDPVTEDLAIAHKGDEEGHRRVFQGFLREYEALAKTFGKGR